MIGYTKRLHSAASCELVSRRRFGARLRNESLVGLSQESTDRLGHPARTLPSLTQRMFSITLQLHPHWVSPTQVTDLTRPIPPPQICVRFDPTRRGLSCPRSVDHRQHHFDLSLKSVYCEEEENVFLATWCSARANLLRCETALYSTYSINKDNVTVLRCYRNTGLETTLLWKKKYQMSLVLLVLLRFWAVLKVQYPLAGSEATGKYNFHNTHKQTWKKL